MNAITELSHIALFRKNLDAFAWSTKKEWCGEMEVERKFTTVGYPQANNQAKVTN